MGDSAAKRRAGCRPVGSRSRHGPSLRDLTNGPLYFLVVIAKLITGFDTPQRGVLYLNKLLTAHTLFQPTVRPNRITSANRVLRCQC